LAAHINVKLKLLFDAYPDDSYCNGDTLIVHTKKLRPQQYADVLRLLCDAWTTSRRLHIDRIPCRFACRDAHGGDDLKHYLRCEVLCHVLHQAAPGAVPVGPAAVGLGPIPVLLKACTATEVYRIVCASRLGNGATICVQVVPSIYEGHDNLAFQRPPAGVRRLATVPYASS